MHRSSYFVQVFKNMVRRFVAQLFPISTLLELDNIRCKR